MIVQCLVSAFWHGTSGTRCYPLWFAVPARLHWASFVMLLARQRRLSCLVLAHAPKVRSRMVRGRFCATLSELPDSTTRATARIGIR